MRFTILLAATLALGIFGVPPPAGTQDTTWEAHMAAGVGAYQEGRYGDAEQLFVRALVEAEGLGPDNSRLFLSAERLGELYHMQGRDAEAEPLFRRALAIRETLLGPEDRSRIGVRRGFWGGGKLCRSRGMDG